MASKRTDRHSPTRRRRALRALLADSRAGLSLADLAAELKVDQRTVIRYLRILEADGESLIESVDENRKLWRLDPKAKPESIAFDDNEMISLLFLRCTVGFLKGTGIAEDIESLFEKIVAALGRRGIDLRDAARKFLDVNEAPHIYAGRMEIVDEIVTGLVRNQSLVFTRARDPEKKGAFKFDPYTLSLYKKGLYITGWSHEHGEVRTYALDGLADVERLPGETFAYPEGHDPAKRYEGIFGIHTDKVRHVRLRFDAIDRIVNLVERRQWHATQAFVMTTDGFEMAMDVGGVELVSWLLGWGDRVEVLEPEKLRRDIADEHYRAAVKNRWKAPVGVVVEPEVTVAAEKRTPALAKAKPATAPEVAMAKRRARS